MKRNKFSSHSRAVLKTVHPALQEILRRALLEYDFSVLCGHRGQAEQDAAYDAGFSKVRWPFSKHNTTPALAVDIAPYPTLYQDPVKFTELAIIVKRIAGELMTPIRWGGDFASFFDGAHFELVNE